MPWVVFGAFNEIVHPDEKLGGADRDAGQMEAFKDEHYLDWTAW